MRDTLIYVAGSLRGYGDSWKQRENIDRAIRVARELWVKGYTAICPHLNNLEMDGPELVSDDILAGDFVIIERCDAIVVVPGSEKSAGTYAEIRFANDMGIPVYFYPALPEYIRPRGDTAEA